MFVAPQTVKLHPPTIKLLTQFGASGMSPYRNWTFVISIPYEKLPYKLVVGGWPERNTDAPVSSPGKPPVRSKFPASQSLFVNPPPVLFVNAILCGWASMVISLRMKLVHCTV